MTDAGAPVFDRAGDGLTAPDVAELRDGFGAVEARLQHDVAAMRDSISPARFDDARLDAAQAAFTAGFSALDAAIPDDAE